MPPYTKRKSRVSVLLKIIILAAVTYGVIMSTDDPYTFTKFTTLSNIGIGVAMLLAVFAEIRDRDADRQRMYVFKFMMTIGVVITFMLYVTLLAPGDKNGFLGAFANHHYGSLMLHVVSPVLSVVDFYRSDSGYEARLIHSLFGILPPVAYVGMIYVMSQNGYRWAHGAASPYKFLDFGSTRGWIIIILLIVAFILIGTIMLAIRKRRDNRS